MPQHEISRKELKRDEFRDSIVHGAEAVATHQKTAWSVGGAILVVALGIFGWRFYTQRQTVTAEAGLGDALKTYEARIATPSEPAAPGEMTFGDEKTRDIDSEHKFSDVAARYPRTRPGLMARYYDALCLESLGSNDAAENDLKAVAGGSDPDFAALARYQLAQFYDRNGSRRAVPATGKHSFGAGAQGAGAAEPGRSLRGERSRPSRQTVQPDQDGLFRHARRRSG